MTKKTGIDWKALEKAKGEVVASSNVDVIKLDKDETFIGKYIGSEEIQLGDNDPFISFKFETEKGNQAFSGGMNFTQQMRMINLNAIIRVTAKGKKKTKSGYKVNQFLIEALTPNAINEKEREKIKSEITLQMKKKNKNTKKGKK